MALSSLPALSIRPPDIARSLLAAESIKGARTQNRLAETQLAQTRQKRALIGEIIGGNDVAGRVAGPRASAAPGATSAPTSATGALDMPLLRRLAVIDPKSAKAILDFSTTADEAQREAARKGAEALAKPILYLKSLPEDQRPAAYQRLRARILASGQELPNPMPEQYDESWAERVALQAMTLDQVLDMTGQGAGGERFGLTPIWATDANGNPVLLQPSNRGGVQRVELPPGVTPQRGRIMARDIGNAILYTDANGNPISVVPKGIAPQQSIDEKGNRIITAPGVPGGAPVAAQPTAAVPSAATAATIVPPATTMPAASAAPAVTARQPATPQGGSSTTRIPPSAAQRRAGLNALRGFERQAKIVSDTVDEALALVGPFTTGYGAFLADLPNTDARRLRNALDTIKANVGFDKLQQLRDASPTGGALGQVSELENRLLQAVNGAIDPMQRDQLVQNLETIRTLYGQVMEERRAAFRHDFGGQPSASEGGSSRRPPEKAPADMSDDELREALGL